MSDCRRLGTVSGHLLTNVQGVPSVRLLSSTTGGVRAATSAVLDTRSSITVLNSTISFLDTKQGDHVVVFLHGNPTAAYLWRNIIPHVQPIARCVAPDLIGMGHSGKVNIRYTFAEHYDYLCAWIDAMNFPGKLTIVCHDWGSGLGFHWCNQHRDRVHSIVHMESLVCPIPNMELFLESNPEKEVFQKLRSAEGEQMTLKENFMVEKYFTGNVIREMSTDEMNEYRAPYRTEQSRVPTLTWPREIPFVAEGPQEVVNIVLDYHNWLSTSADLPKLFIGATPGYFSDGIKLVIQDWLNQKMVDVKGRHFLQEDSPDEIGRHITDFLMDVYQLQK